MHNYDLVTSPAFEKSSEVRRERSDDCASGGSDSRILRESKTSERCRNERLHTSIDRNLFHLRGEGRRIGVVLGKEQCWPTWQRHDHKCKSASSSNGADERHASCFGGYIIMRNEI